MSEEISAVSTTAENSAPANSESAPAQNTESSQSVVDQEEISQLKAHNEALSRKLGSIEHTIKKLARSQEEKAPEVNEKTEDASGITARMRELEAFKQEAEEEKILTRLESALTANGVQHAERYARMLRGELGGRLAVDARRVVVDDGGEMVGVENFIPDYLRTDHGSFMLPAKNASSHSTKSSDSQGSSGKKQITLEQANNLSADELKSGKYTF